MTKYALLAGVIWMLAAATAASASPYNRNCGDARDGWVVGQLDPTTNNYPYEVNGPWHIKMSAGEAIRITKRLPPSEFDTRIPLRDTPCIVGQAIASSASRAWSAWKGNNGWVQVSADTYGGMTHLGRFYCKGHAIPNAVVKETCTMRYRGGKVIGSFTIYDNPYD